MDTNYFGKCRVSELRAELSQARKKAKPQARIKVVLKRVISNIILNKIELASLMNDIVGLFTYDNYEISRHCSHYITHYAVNNPDDALGALDFYLRFARAKDPLFRALAIKTVSSVPIKQYFRLGVEMAHQLLHDKNPHVRTAAAFAVARLFQQNEKKVSESGLIEELNTLLYDENKNVVSNALAALDSITQSSETHSFNVYKEHLLQLISGIGTTSEWKQIYLLDALMSYVPQTSEDAIQMMEAILSCLLHENVAVVLNTVKLIVYLSNFIESPEAAIPLLDKRVGAALVSLLYKPAEIQFLVLRNVILLLLGRRYLVELDVKQFFWNFDDPMFVKDTKIEIIYLLANEDNLEIVFRELEEYATNRDEKMSRKAVRAFGILSVKLEAAAARCMTLLTDLLTKDSPHIVQESIVVFCNIIRKYGKPYEKYLDQIVEHYKILVDTDGRIALAWLVGQYVDKVTISDEIIEYFCNSFEKESLGVQQAIMTTIIKYYVAFPKKAEPLVLKILKFATEETGNPDLRERGYFYWHMISHKQNSTAGQALQRFTREIVVNGNVHIKPVIENIDPENLDELELNIGTLASIYLKPIRQVFKYAKIKTLPSSPVIVERRKPPPSSADSG